MNGGDMVCFAVSEEKNQGLKEKMKALGIRERDLEEKFVRSSGKGGQKVNKTSTCVYIKHLPTGIQVKCMRERSQSINRFLARRELVEKIERKSGHGISDELRKQRIIKQKRRRKRRFVNKLEKVDGSRATNHEGMS